MLRARQLLGKYRIEGRLSHGPYAMVYRALDTIEGIRVALKIPHPHLVDDELLDSFRREARMAASLEHPNILPLKNASFIDDNFVIATALGEKSLADRLQSRMGVTTAISFAEQMLDALGYAHQHNIIHCDVKPENMILFPKNRLKLADFGIAKVAMRTIRASGSGTIGYMAPEQAMGKPSFRSDVFCAGLLIYRLFSGRLPEWPFEWPPEGQRRFKQRVHPQLARVIKKSLDVDSKKRFKDAKEMLTAFLKAKPKALEFLH